MKLRRVVTGFDSSGKAVISSDEQVPDQEYQSGVTVSSLWGYADKVSFDAPNVFATGSGPFDTDSMHMSWGTAELAPGATITMHSTQTVDLITVLEGEVTCTLDSGEVIVLQAHDVLLQRGVVHAWENRGAVSCAWTYATLGSL